MVSPDFVRTSSTPNAVRSYDYQGCSDNVQYGIAISREFVDAAERGKNASQRAILNLHNNRAGRQAGFEPATQSIRVYAQAQLKWCNAESGSPAQPVISGVCWK
ncbi:unnamed protein product [Nippostrongylus brasiliensis]|uniref:Protein Wnt n=1 Tax=Nippostrongylus brasiliensis TaxID=27835 RepID=A0A0N4XIW7_NIPBR|nr:unnamed protein product [Nippostrongylus brasiliensis]